MSLLARGARPAAEVRDALEISPATLSRLAQRERDFLLRLGQGRATRYALAKPIEGLPGRVPIYRVRPTGKASRVAELLPLLDGQTWVERSRGGGHLHAGLPPVVHDLAPAGYLGRRFADQHPDLRLPPRLQDWSDEQRLISVARRGEDLPGDLILGEESLNRFLATGPLEVTASQYPRLAEASAQGGAGSSAGGEHPKFAAFREGRHLLVKFTQGDGSPTDLRWRDLLVCEALALDVLAAHGHPAAAAQIVDVGSRRFLEVERFDRIGLRGRRGVLSLGPLADDLFGFRDTWTDAATRLLKTKLLSAEDARRVRLLEAFGLWIANGDRHFGNLSFFADGLDERPALALTPTYDMLPMDAAPRAGVVPPVPEKPPIAHAKWLDVWEEAQRLGAEFWGRVAADQRIGDAFRRTAAQRAAA
jgi:hypothetical protein